MLIQKDIHKLITSGESDTVEFKQSFNNEVIETIVAFANTSGGSVFIGISNTGKLLGASIEKETICGVFNLPGMLILIQMQQLKNWILKKSASSFKKSIAMADSVCLKL